MKNLIFTRICQAWMFGLLATITFAIIVTVVEVCTIGGAPTILYAFGF